MIVPSLGVKVLIAMKPVDFRKGMDGLAALVRETLGANPFGGVIYVFRSKRAADFAEFAAQGLLLAREARDDRARLDLRVTC